MLCLLLCIGNVASEIDPKTPCPADQWLGGDLRGIQDRVCVHGKAGVIEAAACLTQLKTTGSRVSKSLQP